jgi:hypothetical protein
MAKTAQYRELNTRYPEWQREAVRLARSGTPFILTGFDSARDSEFYFALKQKFKLQARVDHATGQAWFKPRPSDD